MHHHRWFAAIAFAIALAGSALAQNVAYDPMLMAGAATRVVVQGGWVYTGLRQGGLVAWNAADPTEQRAFTQREGLGGADVTDLVWTGRNLWVATHDGGLTRLTNPADAAPAVRGFASNLSSLAVTAVAGAVVGQTERVWYGTEASGIGIINDGLAGGYYTTADGLLDDHVTSLALAQDVVYVATPSGVAKFAGNLFTTLGVGLDATVSRLAIDDQGRVLAATDDGLRRWDEDLDRWTTLAGAGLDLIDLAIVGSDIWLLRRDGGAMVLRDDQLLEIGAPPALPEAATIIQAIGAAGDDLWVAGRHRPGDIQSADSIAGFAWLAGRHGGAWTQWHRDGSVVGDADGVAFDATGRAWVGERNGDGLSGLSPQGTWSHVTDVASVANDSTGLFNQLGGVLSIVTDAAGDLWFCQYNSGVVRVRDDGTDLIFPAVSGLAGTPVIRLGTHPDGPIFVMTDPNVADSGVQVLVDPDHWRNPAVWVTPDVGGNNVMAALAERRDVIWFAVQGVGLVRWDPNGPFAGPTDDLTWTDLADDRMLTFTAVPGANAISIAAVAALALGADGAIWVAANGVLTFAYDEVDGFGDVHEYRQKTNSANAGLLSNSVVDVALDRNGDVWALTNAGLNRIHPQARPLVIDAFADLESFLSVGGSGLYSANIVAPLPGGTYRQLASSAGGEQLVVSSDRGAARLTIAAAEGGAVADDALAGLYLYPNPFGGAGGDGFLHLAGLPAGGSADDRATVEILNLQGQIVYRVNALDPTRGFFGGGATRTGDAVASGLYVVKVEYRGATAVRTLAVVK